jgi:pimeloyl-ACP methyl ester carboxylesterase
MAHLLPDSLMQVLTKYWSTLPKGYRTPVLLTSCTALLISPYIWERLTYTPELLPPFPKGSGRRFEQADDSSSKLTLPDGRTIGYAQYGDPQGKPIICLHGILGSRLENALFDVNAKDLGARIIGIERPGMGWSSPDPRPLRERKVIDHARDVEALAEHLSLTEYAIIGTSGGGPYALGCARALPSSPSKPRLKAVSIVTGLGLRDMSQTWSSALVWLNQQLDLRWLFKRLFTSGPVWNMALSDDERMEEMRKGFDLKKAHPADARTAKNPNYPDSARLFLLSSREAVSQGYQGFADDGAILSADPGFRVEDIRSDLPIQLWCGTDDTNASPKAGEETAQRLRASGNKLVELHMEAGETHGSTQVKYQRRILEDLLRAMSS